MEVKMAIPDFESTMLPLLKFLSDRKEHPKNEAVDALAKQFELTDEELAKMQPSGRNHVFDNRVAWARNYLNKAGLVDSPRWGYWRISDEGLKVLKDATEINIKFLLKIPMFKTWLKKEEKSPEVTVTKKTSQSTPDELFETGYKEIQDALVQDLLVQIKRCSWAFFEKLVVELLLKMGYGGSRQDAGEAIGKTGDEGIDGIIKEDRLGLDCIYLQAKRWGSQVGRPEIQKFAGALIGKHAKKGVFITTSGFSKEALDFVKNIENKIVLIDGEMLAQLMIENNVGVFLSAAFEIKKIDSDYFNE
jgi:restriction system protein